MNSLDDRIEEKAAATFRLNEVVTQITDEDELVKRISDCLWRKYAIRVPDAVRMTIKMYKESLE